MGSIIRPGGADGPLQTINNIGPDNNGNINLASADFAITAEDGSAEIQINEQVPLNVNLSVSPTTAEVGDTIPNPALSWSYTDDTNLVSQLLDQGIGTRPVAERAYTDTGANLTSNTTYTILAEDSFGATDSDAAAVQFLLRVYAGETASGSNLDQATIKAGTRVNTLSATRSRTINFEPGGAYVWYAYPVAYGLSSVTDENNFPLSAWRDGGAITTDPYVVSVTNDFGHVEDYYVYHSFNFYNGATLTLKWS